MNLVSVGHDIWVGDYLACTAARREQFDRAIHVWHPTNPYRCRHLRDGPDDQTIIYLDGQPLSEASRPIEDVARFAAAPGRLLVHCQAGLCRSPTYAVLALAARGADPFDALGVIARAIWTGYETTVRHAVWPKIEMKVPHFFETALTEILE
ncbi:hypothetical protein B7486_66470, partial [cyanobacterium TDX16]